MLQLQEETDTAEQRSSAAVRTCDQCSTPDERLLATPFQIELETSGND
jgi:hypothetical protein